MIKFDEEKQNKQLAELRLKEAEDLAETLSGKYDIPYIDLSTVSISSDALRLLPESEARNALLAPFHLTGKEVHIASASPQKSAAKDALADIKEQGYKIFLYMASKRSLERAWERYKELSYSTETEAGILDISNKQILSYIKNFKGISDVIEATRSILFGKQKYQTTRLLEVLIAGAIATNASDIHIEPEETDVKLRYRLDGVLMELLAIDTKIYTLMLSRIKILSGLKINVRNDAQNGRFTIRLGETDIEVRTSTVPGAYGESIVLRILNPKSITIPFEKLGMHETLRTILEEEISQPNGMILNTGPTGSGKTTTLYTILRKLNKPEIKIITIENPIEYHLPGITQTQVDRDAGYTMIQGMRSALRQDPDIMMIGEIRDSEAAETAVQAALTGHLVLSTLHTNNAAGAIPRLIDLGVNPKIIGSALNIALAQRLVRILCAKCKKEDTPTAEEVEVIQRILEKSPIPFTSKITRLWHPGSCEECNNTGYKGRIGIFEAIRMDKEIEELATRNPSEREIKKTARAQGIPDMREDGIMKVLQGVTSLEELRRVISLRDEDEETKEEGALKEKL